MKHNKKVSIIIMVILIIVTFQGCGFTKKSQIHTVQGDQESIGTVDVKFMKESINEDGILFSKLLDSDNNKSILYYKDNQSGKSVALCNKPECSHDDADCAAVYDGTIKAAFFGKGHLFVFTTLMETENANFIKSMNTTYVYEADKDGSNRKLVSTLNYQIDGNFDLYDDFANIPVVYHIPVADKDESGNVVGYHTSEENVRHTVLQLDFDTGKFTNLIEKPFTQPNFQWNDLTYYDGDLWIGFEYGTNDKSSDLICRYDASAKKMDKEYDLSSSDSYIGVIGDSVYYYTLNNGMEEIFRSSLTHLFSPEEDEMIYKGSNMDCLKMFHGILLTDGNAQQTLYLDADSGKVTDITNSITKNVLAYGYINNYYGMVLLKQGSFESGIISLDNIKSDVQEYIYTGSLQ